jgi:AraC family transcriptional regulator
MRVRSGVGRQDAIVCHLPVDRLAKWLDMDREWTDQYLDASLDIATPAIDRLLIQLGEEARSPGFASEAMGEAIAMQIAIHLERFYRGTSMLRTSSDGLATWRLRLIDDRLLEVGSSPSLTELATLCNLSVRQLSRGFKNSRGVSIGEYVAHERIEHARRLLRSGLSVKAVAYALGFASLSSFSFAFRRATGTSPSHFRTSTGLATTT